MSGRRASTTLIPLSCAQIHLVRSLWRQIYTTKGPTVIGTSIYHRLCFKCPVVVENLDSLDNMTDELIRIGKVHARMLRGELNAETFIDCTLEWGDRRCRSETVRKAWALIVAFVVEKIKLGHHEQFMSKLDSTHDYTPGFLSAGGFDSAAMSFFHDGNGPSLNAVGTTTSTPTTLELLCLKKDSSHSGLDIVTPTYQIVSEQNLKPTGINFVLQDLVFPPHTTQVVIFSSYECMLVLFIVCLINFKTFNITLEHTRTNLLAFFPLNFVVFYLQFSFPHLKDIRQEPATYCNSTSNSLFSVNSNQPHCCATQPKHVEPTDRTLFLNPTSNITPHSHMWHGIIPNSSVELIGGSVVNTPVIFQLPVSTPFPIVNFPSIQRMKKETEGGVIPSAEPMVWNSFTPKDHQANSDLFSLNGRGDELSDTKKKPSKRKKIKTTDEYRIEEEMDTIVKNDVLENGNIDIIPKRKYKKRKKEEFEERKSDGSGASHGELIKMKKSRMAYNKGTFIIRYSDMESPEYAGHIWLVDNHQLLQKYTLDGVKGDGIREYSKTERYSGWLCDEPCLYFPLAEVKESYDNMQKVIVSFFPSPQEIEAMKKEQLKQKLGKICAGNEHTMETQEKNIPWNRISQKV
uniref:GLOBIN domain-containing protein n=1 Tax=Heterorhabditis bacteriophora TaxID=37862 RepID=A0A1I7XP53_HETBA